MRFVGLFAVAAVLSGVVLVSAVPATAASPHANVTFGAAPATKGKIDGRPYFTFDASAGGGLEDHIGIINFARHAQELSVYAVDATSATDGDFVYAPKGAPRTGAGGWIAVGTPHASGLVRVKGRSTTILPIHLQVPSNAQPGDHAAAVIVSLTSLVKGKSGERVHLEQRVATRVIVRVSGTLRPQLTIMNLKASYAGHVNPFAHGNVTVTYTVHNSGNVLLGGAQQVSVHGLFGTTTNANTVPPVPLLLPGGSYAVRVHLSGVAPEISMTAKVRITPDGLQGDVNPGVQVVTASVHFWAIPWLLIVVILAALLAAVGEFIRRRRRSRKAGGQLGTPIPQGVTT